MMKVKLKFKAFAAVYRINFSEEKHLTSIQVYVYNLINTLRLRVFKMKTTRIYSCT